MSDLTLRRASASTTRFRLRFRVTTVETVPFQRHPPGALDVWRLSDRQTPPRREELALTIAHLEPVGEHGETTTVDGASTDLHAMGGFDIRSVHPKAQETFGLGWTFDLTVEGA